MFVWPVMHGASRWHRPENERYVGQLGHRDRGDDGRGRDPLDAFLDLSLADDLETQFVLAAPPRPDAGARGDRAADPQTRWPWPAAATAARTSAQLRRRRLHHSPAHRVGAQPAVARGRGAAASPRFPPRSTRHPRPRARSRAAAGPRPARRPRQPGYARLRRATCRTFLRNSGRFVCDATGYHSVIVNGSVLLRRRRLDRRTPGSSAPDPRAALDGCACRVHQSMLAA